MALDLRSGFSNYGEVVRFNLTNEWHFGTIYNVGRKWVHIEYRTAGKIKRAKVLKTNVGIDLKEV